MRTGVFLCQCGGNISRALDLDRLAEHVNQHEHVAPSAIVQFLCGTEGCQKIAQMTKDLGLDRLVIGACSPRFQGPTFERLARDLGLGENAVAFANLREGCAFIHQNEPAPAQEKAKKILSAAIARAARQKDLSRSRTFVSRSAMVVGGGIAGLAAAEELARAGIDVHLVEHQASLGGSMARLSKTFPTEDCSMCSLAPRLASVAMDARIHVHTLTDVTSFSGSPGAFHVGLRHRPRYVKETCVACGACIDVCPVKLQPKPIGRLFENAVPPTFAIDPTTCIRCAACSKVCPAGSIDLNMAESHENITVGAIVVATGHQEFDATRKIPYGLGRFENVLTQSQLARLLSATGPTGGDLKRPSDGTTPRRVFMLQCVGSRDQTSSGNAHCSAICCMFATLHASIIRQQHPDTEVTIAYTDLRAPGKDLEEYYQLVQSRGVRYVRGRVSEILQESSKSLRIRFEDTLNGRKHDELFDLVVLSAGLEASEGTTRIASVLGLQTGKAGFIREYHPKLSPVDTQRMGIFACGTALGPKAIPDAIAQGKAAAARTLAMLASGYLLTQAQIAFCDPTTCLGCGTCQTSCPHGAVILSAHAPFHAIVDPASCRGCGICAATCPSSAMQTGGYSDEELRAEVMA